MIILDKEALLSLPQLERAIIIATLCHTGAKDKGGNPYILHPLKVALELKEEEEMIAGILHDVVEDTELTLEDLLSYGFSISVVEAVDSLTRREGETYREFVLRARENPIGRAVKIQDVKNNMDLSRIPSPSDKDRGRIKRYEKALGLLIYKE